LFFLISGNIVSVIYIKIKTPGQWRHFTAGVMPLHHISFYKPHNHFIDAFQ